MKTLRDAGFRPAVTAAGGGMSVSMGTLTTGEVVVVASTPKGNGYTPYTFAYEAREAFEAIVSNMGLVKI